MEHEKSANSATVTLSNNFHDSENAISSSLNAENAKLN